MKCFISLFILVIHFDSIKAQERICLNIDQGLCFNLPSQYKETLYSFPSSTYNFETYRKNYATTGFFVEATLDIRFIKKNLFSIYFVSGIGYFEIKKKYRDSTNFVGCFGWGQILDSVSNKNKSIYIPTGLKMKYVKNKFTISSSIFLNPMWQFYSRNSIYDIKNGTVLENDSNATGLKLHLSVEIGFQYTFKRNISFGPSIEFYSQNLLLHYGKYYPNKFFLLNPGLKVILWTE